LSSDLYHPNSISNNNPINRKTQKPKEPMKSHFSLSLSALLALLTLSFFSPSPPLAHAQRAECSTNACDTTGNVGDGTTVRLTAPDWFDTFATFTWYRINPIVGVALRIDNSIPTQLRVTVSRPPNHGTGWTSEVYTVNANGGGTMIMNGERFQDWNGQAASISVNMNRGPGAENGKKDNAKAKRQKGAPCACIQYWDWCNPGASRCL
jgi:hypothetical protein